MYVKVVRVVDGDTLHIVCIQEGQPQKHPIRLFGIDTPELKPKITTPHRELHQNAAKAVGRYVESVFAAHENLAWVEFQKKEKYGRLMGEVFIESKEDNMKIRTSVNKLLLSRGFALSYDGKGPRPQFSVQRLQDILSELSPSESET